MNFAGITIDNWNQYKSNSDLIVKLIKNFYSGEKIKFQEPKGLDLYTVQIGSGIKITIMPDDTWISIKKNIDSKLYNLNKSNNICRLCELEMEIKTECNQCKKSCCIECYIKNFRKNKGIIKCDNCNFSFGQKTPDSYINVLIGDIRENARAMNKNKNKSKN